MIDFNSTDRSILTWFKQFANVLHCDSFIFHPMETVDRHDEIMTLFSQGERVIEFVPVGTNISNFILHFLTVRVILLCKLNHLRADVYANEWVELYSLTHLDGDVACPTSHVQHFVQMIPIVRKRIKGWKKLKKKLKK